MAPILSEEELAIDPYELLGLKVDATEKEVQRAYRQMSLKWHPDKNPDNPDAATKMHLITVASTILRDPSKRSFLNSKLDEDRRRKEKYAGLEKRKRGMVDSLLAREEEARIAKLARTAAVHEATAEEQIREAGRKMREAAAAASAGGPSSSRSQPNKHAPEEPEEPQPPIQPLDLTLTLQFPSTTSPTPFLESTDTLSSHLSSLYGPLAHVLLKPASLPSGKSKKPKGPKAVVEFREGNWHGCHACWRDHSGEPRRAGLGEGVKIAWAGGEVPAWVGWADRRTERAKPVGAGTLPGKVAAAVRPGGEDEGGTLERMRRMERERMAERMRREEEEEERV